MEQKTNEQWEYITFTFRHSFRYDDDTGLDKLGQQGWEAYAVRAMDRRGEYYATEIFLKRRKGGLR